MNFESFDFGLDSRACFSDVKWYMREIRWNRPLEGRISGVYRIRVRVVKIRGKSSFLLRCAGRWLLGLIGLERLIKIFLEDLLKILTGFLGVGTWIGIQVKNLNVF